MSETDYKKYWFIKLPRNFFNRHDIKIIESMPNGKDYCLFYLKLLLESVTHNGELRFNETIPYDENMLSVVTNTNVDVVRSAMKLLHELKLIELLDDQTIFMTEVNKMIGVETGSAVRKREYRDRQKLLSGTNGGQCPQDKELDKELDIDKELDNKEINKEKDGFIKPTLEQIQEYCQFRNNNVNAEQFFNFYESKGWQVGKTKMKDWKACIRTWESRQPNVRNEQWFDNQWDELKREYYKENEK